MGEVFQIIGLSVFLGDPMIVGQHTPDHVLRDLLVVLEL